MFSSEISQTSQTIHSLLVQGGFGAPAEGAPDLLLRIQPSANSRHHPVHLSRMSGSHVVCVPAVRAAIVQFDLVHSNIFAFLAVDELPVCIQKRQGIDMVLQSLYRPGGPSFCLNSRSPILMLISRPPSAIMLICTA